ncbi:MAG: hypothetical protein H7Y32_14140 [Chloroflexales bacterium]|nr:hypothetical protein [Chloroflexales bacterium]
MDDKLQALIDFLRQHRGTYNTEALRAQLLAQGHDEQLVEAALVQVRAELVTRDLRSRTIAANVVIAMLTSVLAFFAIGANTPNPWWLLIFAPLLELMIGGVFRARGHTQIGTALIYTSLYSLVPMAAYALFVRSCVIGFGG